ncbi:hypothetical protein QR680_016967 [Steinernema hermaphroditum]|uniref:SANTA domain-containing protein n=1 Tax=Steinernema hermaphroditum TaxID=289476 RepID=A0AA39LMT8_9BILA|nr:hypothetical protein QR680_016967 [Steinernema hermaphroditum]
MLTEILEQVGQIERAREKLDQEVVKLKTLLKTAELAPPLPSSQCLALVPVRSANNRVESEDKITIRDWYFRLLVRNFDPTSTPFDGFAVILGGIRTDTNQEWITGSVVNVVKKRTLCTGDNTYKLDGPISERSMIDMGFPQDFILRVAEGFPRNYKSVFEKFYASVRNKADAYVLNNPNGYGKENKLSSDGLSVATMEDCMPTHSNRRKSAVHSAVQKGKKRSSNFLSVNTFTNDMTPVAARAKRTRR